MMSVKVPYPSYIYGDSIYAIGNTQHVESTLNKRIDTIYYHAFHESVVMVEYVMSHIISFDNFSDFLIKVLYGQKSRFIVGQRYMTLTNSNIKLFCAV